MSKSNPQSREALAKLVAVLPEGEDTTDLADWLNELVRGSEAIRNAGKMVVADIAEDLQSVKDGTITDAQFQFALGIVRKRVVILGDAAKIRTFKAALGLFIDRLLGYLRKVQPGGAPAPVA